MKNFAQILFCLYFFTSLNAQKDINLSKSHNPANCKMEYIIDNIHLDSISFSKFQLRKKDIVRLTVNAKNCKIIYYTKLLIVFDDALLFSDSDKKRILYNVNYNTIKSIERIDIHKSKTIYGKWGKNGTIIIKTR